MNVGNSMLLLIAAFSFLILLVFWEDVDEDEDE